MDRRKEKNRNNACNRRKTKRRGKENKVNERKREISK